MVKQAPLTPRLPNGEQHIAIAGMTGSGKTEAALSMLGLRDFGEQPWLIVDHKRDDKIAKIPAETLNLNTRFLPSRGLFVTRPSFNGKDKEDLDDLLGRIFRKGNFGIYVDEGHLMGRLQSMQEIMVAGRSRRVCCMWISQRASHIDPFIWSQSTFYRVFRLQTALDKKRFNENFPIKWFDPEPFHSHYFDGTQGHTFYLGPSPRLDETLKRIDVTTMSEYKTI
jgi:hypothetical protein